MDAIATSLLVPPRPPPAPRELSLLPFLRAARNNALTIWTERAYQELILANRLLGRSRLLVNEPGGDPPRAGG